MHVTSCKSRPSSPRARINPSARAFCTARVGSPGNATCNCSTRPLTKGTRDKPCHFRKRCHGNREGYCFQRTSNCDARHDPSKQKLRWLQLVASRFRRWLLCFYIDDKMVSCNHGGPCPLKSGCPMRHLFFAILCFDPSSPLYPITLAL